MKRLLPSFLWFLSLAAAYGQVELLYSFTAEEVSANSFLNFGGKTYFEVVERQKGQWQYARRRFVTDGTPQGTHPVSNEPWEIYAYVEFNGETLLYAKSTANDSLYIAGFDTTAFEIQPIFNLPVGGHSFFQLGNKLLFFYGQGIWVTDLTAAGTFPLKQLENGYPLAPFSACKADSLYFFTHQNQVWRTDGTAGGTFAVWSSPFAFEPAVFFALRGKCLFQLVGSDLWASDGTVAGTQVILDDNQPGFYHLDFSQRALLDSVVVFQAGEVETGVELWRTDGTAAGTFLLKDLRPGTEPPPTPKGLDSNPHYFLRTGGITFFIALDEQGFETVWRTDGTADGTSKIASSCDHSECHIYRMYRFHDRILFFPSTLENGEEPWVSDGTEEGTHLVKDIHRGLPGCRPNVFSKPLGSPKFFYFEADDGRTGRELWRSDGTEAGTELIKDFVPGAQWSRPKPGGVSGNSLYFLTGEFGQGFHLWKMRDESAAEPAPTFPQPYEWLQIVGNASFLDYENECNNNDLLTDPQGNVFLSATSFGGVRLGVMNEPFLFPNYPLESVPYRHFVVKFDPAGKPLWTLQIANGDGETEYWGGLPLDHPFEMALDSAGNLFAAGTLVSDFTFANEQEILAEDGRFFVGKWSAEGQAVWLRQFDIGVGVVGAVAGRGKTNLLVAGTFTGKAVFDDFVLETDGAAAGFLLELNGEGQTVRAKMFELPAFENQPVLDVAAGKDGWDYVLTGGGEKPWGWYESTFKEVRFWGANENGQEFMQKITSERLLSPWFLAQAPDGILNVVGNFSRPLSVEGTGFSFNPLFGSYVALIGFTPQGLPLFAKQLGEKHKSTFFHDLVFDEVGNFWATVETNETNTARYPTYPFHLGGDDIFVRKYGPDFQLLGEQAFVKISGGGGSLDVDRQHFPQLVADGSGQVLLADRFLDLLDTFAVSSGSQPGGRIFLMKFSLPAVEPPLPGDSLAEDATLLFPNPVHDLLFLKSGDPDFQEREVLFFNVLGQQFELPALFSGSSIQVFGTGSLEQGTYFAAWRKEGKWVAKQFVKI